MGSGQIVHDWGLRVRNRIDELGIHEKTNVQDGIKFKKIKHDDEHSEDVPKTPADKIRRPPMSPSTGSSGGGGSAGGVHNLIWDLGFGIRDDLEDGDNCDHGVREQFYQQHSNRNDGGNEHEFKLVFL